MVKELNLAEIKDLIRNVPDFPRKGIQFKDITTVLKEPGLFGALAERLASDYTGKGITRVACIESRGFILGGALAARLGAGFVPIRKPGKLPAETYRTSYQLEYGTDSLEIHADAIAPGDTVLLHDDLLATGGTMAAAIELISRFNPAAIYLSFFCELDFLKGREALQGYMINSLIHF